MDIHVIESIERGDPLSARKSALLELVEVVTVGLPFCCFKIVAGLSLAASSRPARFVGLVLIALGALDACINAVNLFGLLARGKRPIAACTFALAFTHPTVRAPGAKRTKWHDLGNATDVLLSFTLVALIIGTGRIRELPPLQAAAWNIAVILNVLGAGAARFSSSLRNLREE